MTGTDRTHIMETMGSADLFKPHHTMAVDLSMVRAEEITGNHFHLPSFGPSRYLYEVVTLRDQTAEEQAPGAFAHLTRYSRKGRGDDLRSAPGHFYRICLQDDGILRTVERRDVPFDLDALLLYIMTHELIHIVRFERFQTPFDVDDRARQREEEAVHKLTYEVLRPLKDRKVESLLMHYESHRMPRCF